MKTETRYQIGFGAALRSNRIGLHLLLFLATMVTTLATGGVAYSASILSILLAHEMGHYSMNRYYGMHTSLPYFIPFPSVLPFTNILLNPFGTMGAVIHMRGMIPSRKALFDIGAAGPLAGFVVTLPLLIIGIERSSLVATAETTESALTLGDSLLFKFVVYLLHGKLAEGTDLLLHPIAYAAWAGLLVTAINLLPVGQLDGGHVLYSVFGPRAKRFYLVILALFGGLLFIYPGWALLFGLLLWFGRKHPAPFNDVTPIDCGRKILAGVLLIVFIISFIPVPFKIFQGGL